jgi:uncharacterized protein
MTRLYLGSDFYVPEDAITQTFAIFGKRGSGKSNAGTVLAEAMFKAHLPFVVLDPVDAWWGLKSSFDGKGPGLAVYVFGGPHADLPLNPTAGAMMADVMVEHRISAVLSFKGWTGGERTRFASDFAARLLAKNAEPLHVFLEEADAFIPQRPFKGEEVMLGNFDRMVRWGRQSGIGCTLITQRSAKVNKDVTTQAETLISFRVIGPQDRDAIDNWIKFHAGEEKRQEVLSSIATLKDGQAWVWSPEWLEILRKVSFRRRETYDSAATPKPGEKRPAPKELAQVDLERLTKQMEATVEAAKANDPKELKRTVADLRRQLAQRPKETKVETKMERVEVPILDPAVADQLADAIRAMRAPVDTIARVAAEITEALNRARFHPQPRPASRLTEHPIISRPRPEMAVDTGFRASGGQQRILNVLAWLESVGVHQAERSQVAALSDLAPKAGTYSTYLSRLQSAGLVEHHNRMLRLTEAGRASADPMAAPQTTEELHRQVFQKLGGGMERILRELVTVYDDELSKDELAARTELTANAGTFSTYLSRLRSLGFIEQTSRGGGYRAASVLFLDKAYA